MIAFAFVLVALAGCQSCRELGGGSGLDLPFLDVVYECHVDGGQTLELCWDGDADDLALSLADHGYGPVACGPTSRHLGPCIYCCGADCGRGANAFNGSWCPSSPRAQPAALGHWHLELLGIPARADICDSTLVRPAVGCADGRTLVFDGCRWRCTDARQ